MEKHQGHATAEVIDVRSQGKLHAKLKFSSAVANCLPLIRSLASLHLCPRGRNLTAHFVTSRASHLFRRSAGSKISLRAPMPDNLVIAGRAFNSRLIVGTGKYRSFQEMARAHAASGADMVTVAVRRVNLTDKSKESLLDYIDREKIFILPNTAACYTADEAIRTARLAREVGLSNWIKLEVIGDQQTLFPDTEQLIEATRVLVKEGFVVLPYTNDDLIAARKLIDAGAAAVMPLAAPIGSGLGVQNPANLRILRERITEVPMIVDAGVGTASDAAVAMELGADGVLMNTAIAEAQDAVLMAEAMRDAVIAGRKCYLAGRMPKRLYASASSPMSGVVR
jgi:thiazole synthase